MIAIRGLIELRQRLASLDVAGACAEAMQETAAALAAQVRIGLSVVPGGPHDRPWLRSGQLHDSIGVDITEIQAVVGSTDAVAVDQELGTTAIPPRPFLAPAAAQCAPELAETIGARVANAMKAIEA